MKFAVTAKCPQCNRGQAFYVFLDAPIADAVSHEAKCNICTRPLFRVGVLPESTFWCSKVGDPSNWDYAPTSDPLNVSVAEKGPAEQFDEPQIVHDSK